MKVKKEELQHVKVQPCIIVGYNLVSNVMKASYHNAEILKIHIKQCLKEMSTLDKLCNAITTKTNEITRWKSQYDHLSLESAIDDVEKIAPVRFMWGGNMNGEKYMQIGKAEFTAQRGDNHGEKLTKKIHTKKY